MEELPQLMKKSEVADFLRVSEGTVHKWAKSGILPYYLTPGRQVRFKRDDVVKFVKDRGPITYSPPASH